MSHATARLRARDLAGAEAALRKALKRAPRDARAHSMLAAVLTQRGAHDEALTCADAALAAAPNSHEAHTLRADALSALARPREALASYDAALALKPDLRYAQAKRAPLLLALGDADAALQAFDALLRSDPANAALHANHASALLALVRLQEALDAADVAVRLNPALPDAHNNRAVALRDLGRSEEALAAFSAAIQAAPHFTRAHNNRGGLLERLGRYDEALVAYGEAEKRGDADGAYNRALLLLARGDYAEGWRLYESRWRSSYVQERPRTPSAPLWLGDSALAGKTILLTPEQGYGDALMMCRYAPLLAAQGARVIIETRPALVNLLRSLGPDISVIGEGARPPAHDCHCPLMSLPLAMKTTLETVPAATPYLTADPGAVARWRAALGSSTRKRVGFALSGNPAARQDRWRRIPAEQFLTLIESGAELHCLQTQMRAEDEAALRAHGAVHMHGPALTDFSETAALACALDLIVTADTSLAHLAGALGLELIVLAPHIQDVRWPLNREASPWYPAARVLRASPDHDWADALDAVKRALRKRTSA